MHTTSAQAVSGKPRKKKAKTTSEPIDVGTKEFGHRYQMKPELISMSTGHAVHMRVVDETAIDRLLLQNRISLPEHVLCGRIYSDLRRANFSKMPTSKLEPSSGSPDPHSSMLTDSMIEVGKLFDHMDKHVGYVVRNLMTNVILDLKDIASDTEIELFRTALLLVAIRLERRRV